MKMAGDDMISVVADTVGNPALNVAANVAKVSEMCDKHVATNNIVLDIIIRSIYCRLISLPY